MKTIGIDIGTTSICLVLYDCDKKKIVDSLWESNHFLPGSFRQEADRIVHTAQKMLDQLIKRQGEVAGIGISSQMHGILYVDGAGRAVSDFYTWKDTCGERPHQGMSSAAYLSESTGYPMFSGYGTVTHFALGLKNAIPDEGRFLTDIGDYLAMCLCGQKEPVVDATIASSFGGYCTRKESFDLPCLEKAGVSTSFYPPVLKRREKGKGRMAGRYKGVPVFWAVGDNQASFFGAAARAEDGVCVNVGTGSQVSLFDKREISTSVGEIRPFVGNGNLYVQASLNGGKVYERLAVFLEEIGNLFREKSSVEKRPDGYEMAQLLGRQKEETDLRVYPSLYGFRGCSITDSPLAGTDLKAGFIENLTEANFHPGDLVRAYVGGMAAELHGMYMKFPEALRSGRKKIIASGNGIRKNELLRQEIEKQFDLPLYLSEFHEEAAAGAAQFAGEWSI